MELLIPESMTRIKKAVLNFFPSRLSLSAFIFLFGIFFLSVFIPFLSPYHEDIAGAAHFEIAGQAPSLSHWFGTDTSGRFSCFSTINTSPCSNGYSWTLSEPCCPWDFDIMVSLVCSNCSFSIINYFIPRLCFYF